MRFENGARVKYADWFLRSIFETHISLPQKDAWKSARGRVTETRWNSHAGENFELVRVEWTSSPAEFVGTASWVNAKNLAAEVNTE